MLPWRKHVESHTFFQLVGNLTNLHVLDLACGEGFYTRQLKYRGAASVTGVDISDGMIHLAKETEKENPLGLVYHCQNALQLDLNTKFDLVCATYLLNYAKNGEELEQMGNVIVNHLKPGGRFITINSNPDYEGAVDMMFPYGFTRENESYAEGAEIKYRFYAPDNSYIEVINYHLAKSTHEMALSKAGLCQRQWHPVEVSAAGIDEFGQAYWTDILNNQPITALTCVNGDSPEN